MAFRGSFFGLELLVWDMLAPVGNSPEEKLERDKWLQNITRGNSSL
jgi:hypothetical protein